MKIEIDARDIGNLVDAWEVAPELVRNELTAATYEAELLLEREIKEDTPVGATGLLRQSIHSEAPVALSNTVIGVVGTASMHALPVELGTRPHFPPIEPLIDWVQAKLDIRDEEQAEGVALAIARKIAVRGTLGVGMFHRNFHQLRPQIDRMYKHARARIAEGLTGG